MPTIPRTVSRRSVPLQESHENAAVVNCDDLMRRRGDQGDGYSQQCALTAENTVTLGRVRSSMRRTHLVQVQDSGMPCEEVHPTCAWIQLAILPQSEEPQGISQSLLDVPNSRVCRCLVMGKRRSKLTKEHV